MAEMIHDATTPTHASELHENIFNILQRSPHTRDWVVFYQKDVPEPDPWIFYEEERDQEVRGPFKIDFIIYIPDYCSVICLEVENDLRNAKYALMEQYPALQGGPLSLGERTITGQDVPNDHLLAADELVNSLAADELVNILKQLALAMLPNYIITYDEDDFERAQSEWDELRNELEGIGPEGPETIFTTNLETLRPQLLRLTADQIKILDNLKEETRYAIDGAAGTGKTVLAKELAERRCEAGDTVALLCSNPNLIHHLEPWAKKISGGKDKIVVGTPATLPSWAFRNDPTSLAKHQQRLDDSPELEESLKSGFLEDRWASFVDETIADLGQGGIFDYLIVDEAQNLCTEVFLKLMDALLKGGLTKGRFTMFGDFTNQNIVFYSTIEDGRDELKEFIKNLDDNCDLPDTDIELRNNCRNTYQIARKIAELTALGAAPLDGAHGPDVQIEFFSGGEWRERLDDLVRDLKARDFHSRQIILLAASNDDRFNARFNDMDSCGGWRLSNIRETAPTPANDRLRYSDIYDFQGLESDVAILVIPLTGDQVTVGGGAILSRYEHLRKMLYTGMSRANAMLFIVADESYKRFFN